MSRPWLRRHGTTVALVAAAAVAVGYLALDRDAITTDEAEARRNHVFSAWRHDDVTEIAIVRDGESYQLVKADDGTWTVVVGGETHPADELAVDQLLGSLEFATYARELPEPPEDIGSLGLAEPPLRIDVSMGSLQFAFRLGGPAPKPESSRYAAVGDDLFVVVRDSLVEAIDRPSDVFRSKAFVPYFSVDLKSLLITRGEDEAHLVRAPWRGGRGAGFRFAEDGPHAGVRAYAPQLDRIWTALGKMQARSFVPMDQAKAALKPEVTLELRPEEGEPGRILIGGACPTSPDDDSSVLAVREAPSPLAACFQKAELLPLFADPGSLVDEFAIGAGIDEISEVHQQHGDVVLDFARTGTGYHVRKPEDRTIDGPTGDAYLADMLDARGEIASAGAELGEIAATVRIHAQAPIGEGGELVEREEVLELGKPNDGKVLVRRKEDGIVLELDAFSARALEARPVALRSPVLYGAPIRYWAELRIDGGGFDQHYEKTMAGSLTTVKPEGFSPDGAMLEEVVSAVGNASAKRWVAPRPDGSFGLEPPRATVEIVGHAYGEEKAERQVLRLGAATEGGAFAQIAEGDEVFVVERGLEDAILRWMVDRGSLLTPSAKMTRIELTVGDANMIAVQQRGAWGLDGAPQEDPRARDRAAALRDAALDLRTEGAVALGQPEERFGLGSPSATLRVTLESGDEVVIELGAMDTFRGTSIVYARRKGTNATFALSRARFEALRAALDTAG